MSPQYKPSVTWGHNTTQTEDKRNELVKLVKSVGTTEQKHSDCGFYVALAPKDGENTRMEIILNHEDEDYLITTHRVSNEYKKLQESIERDELLKKPASIMSFAPKCGFLFRDEVPDVSLSDQFVWIAKLDSHDGKFDEFMEAVSTHAANVERTEDGTLSFLAFQSRDKENSVTLLERYTSEEYFKNTHNTSESMKEFRSKIQPLMADRVVAGFTPVAGFFDKREALT